MPSSDSHQDRVVVAPLDQADGKVVSLQEVKAQRQRASDCSEREAEPPLIVKMHPVPPPRLTQDELDALSRRLIVPEPSSA